jgi:D-inositol-3-phosphate glycosyltransferase
MSVPLAISFHTLGRVKEATRSPGEPRESLVRIAAETEVVARAGCVVASTPAEAADLIEHYQANPERICVSPPGVDHAVFRPGDKARARRRLGLEPGKLVAFVGRIQPLKGIDVAIAAVAALPGVRLAIVGGPSGPGGGAEAHRLREMGDALAPGRVTFLPPRPHADIACVYRAADAVIVPSRSESFGLVAVEAQACGTPVVASRVGGLAYSVEDDRSGYLIAGHDPADYADALSAILDDPANAERLAVGATEHAARFSWDATADRLIELYQGLVE